MIICNFPFCHSPLFSHSNISSQALHLVGGKLIRGSFFEVIRWTPIAVLSGLNLWTGMQALTLGKTVRGLFCCLLLKPWLPLHITRKGSCTRIWKHIKRHIENRDVGVLMAQDVHDAVNLDCYPKRQPISLVGCRALHVWRDYHKRCHRFLGHDFARLGSIKVTDRDWSVLQVQFSDGLPQDWFSRPAEGVIIYCSDDISSKDRAK